MMNDKAFLRYALEQSFIRPCNTAAESMILHYELSSSRNYVFTDKYKDMNLEDYYTVVYWMENADDDRVKAERQHQAE